MVKEMAVDLNTALEELVEKKVMEIIPALLYKKTRFTPEDISTLYGIHKDNARRMMNTGQFGEVIEITPRNKVVTLEGLLEYEAKHKGFTSGKPKTKVLAGRKKEAAGRI